MICIVEPNIKSLRNRCEASKFLEASLWFHLQYSGLYRLANLWTRTQVQKEYYLIPTLHVCPTDCCGRKFMAWLDMNKFFCTGCVTNRRTFSRKLQPSSARRLSRRILASPPGAPVPERLLSSWLKAAHDLSLAWSSRSS